VRCWLVVEQVWCAVQEPLFVYYWPVVEQVWYAVRTFPLERLRRFVERARHGASQAFLASQLMEQKQGARQQLAQRLLSRSRRAREQARTMPRQWWHWPERRLACEEPVSSPVPDYRARAWRSRFLRGWPSGCVSWLALPALSHLGIQMYCS